MLPESVRIYVCTVPQDMRRSFDGLAQRVRELLGSDPQNGAVYVFVGKRPTRLKVLWWDRNGYCLLYKRLHRALFRLPALDDPGNCRIDAKAFSELISGVDREIDQRCNKNRTKRLTTTLH